MWRGGCRPNISVSASFVWRCLSGSTMTPFPHPAHRTGHANLPHPALGQASRLSFRVQRHLQFLNTLSELIGCPISRSFTTYCVCLELRSLPSTGITRLQRYYKPLRHPKGPACPSRASGWSSIDHALGLPVFRALSLYMLPPLPRRSVWAYCFAHFTQPCQPSPKGSSGRPAHRPFRGLLGVHSRCGLHTRAVTNS